MHFRFHHIFHSLSLYRIIIFSLSHSYYLYLVADLRLKRQSSKLCIINRYKSGHVQNLTGNRDKCYKLTKPFRCNLSGPRNKTRAQLEFII